MWRLRPLVILRPAKRSKTKPAVLRRRKGKARKGRGNPPGSRLAGAKRSAFTAAPASADSGGFFLVQNVDEAALCGVEDQVIVVRGGGVVQEAFLCLLKTLDCFHPHRIL